MAKIEVVRGKFKTWPESIGKEPLSGDDEANALLERPMRKPYTL